MAVRDYWNHPGGNGCVWNTPLGTGAIWSGDTDPDTKDARNGGIINGWKNYGACVWVSHSASDPSARFYNVSATDYDTPGTGGNGTHYDVVLRAPRGSHTPGGGSGGFPIDAQFNIFDTTGQPGKVWHFAPVQIDSFNGGGPYEAAFGMYEDCLSDTFAQDYENKNKGVGSQSAGVIRAYDIDPNRNPSRMPAPYGHLTKIQHVLRYMTDGIYFKANARSGLNGWLKPNSWPELYQDYQGSLSYNRYTGNILYGSLIGIPINEPMDTRLSDPGRQLWWCLQHYGSISRDQAGGGYHVRVCL
jgi:hypothetical protein